ncbi:UDP-2,4-diacetamido-2,4,6-trideoxy-beta-L-altropyranose hydrolase [Aneurinibacillus danicus]|uniref:UDP-2,4-diacetamido-2,4,6-trideoxy-beta-L-altropyranose hydrolase n=1 Tax=Aneurinibacillus danicus TaxID=267746 RepID=A0A511VBA0_9BACL|nr:UDP-2,4-diacetamido-2,4,6-trideoxy-beta-L-altropyranose hydrolase [Aneurinibacillus danicus]GEN36195.1 UDP-2,4-diacetamido-2,4,6-trideoxy-beta-L-altropyranose hydrolase [Aneurinibacillus danicus]
MKVLFRVDASEKIGTGHVMRCLTLAHVLRRRGHVDISFICREEKGNLCNYLIENGYDVYRLPATEEITWEKDAEQTESVLVKAGWSDWLIVDHYQLDAHWERCICRSSRVGRIMVIDDLANRPHECDVLLDQNYYCNMRERYAGLIPDDCTVLLGPEYALLREEFSVAHRNMRERTGELRRVLLFFGGSDPTGETLKALRAWELFLEAIYRQGEDHKHSFIVDVVVGKVNPLREEVRQACVELTEKYTTDICRIMYHCQVNNMAELLVKADVALGAGGVTTWERCYLGVPSLVVMVADNQVETTQAVAEEGAIRLLGWHEEVSVEKIAEELYDLFRHPEALCAMSQASLRLMGAAREEIAGVNKVTEVLEEVTR